MNTRCLLKLRNVGTLIHHLETTAQYSIKEILKVINNNIVLYIFDCIHVIFDCIRFLRIAYIKKKSEKEILYTQPIAQHYVNIMAFVALCIVVMYSSLIKKFRNYYLSLFYLPIMSSEINS